MNHLELFAGIGGFRRALDLLTIDGVMPFRTVGYSENDKNARKTYQANYDTTGEVDMGDIVEFTSSIQRINDLPDVDIVTAGFPCQSFSVMGSQQGFDDEDRGQMFFRIIDILKAKRPRYVLLENVKNLKRHDHGRTFAHIVTELQFLGYNVVSDVFNTADYHLPQRRSRVIIFATTEEIPLAFYAQFSAKNVKEHFDIHFSDTSVSAFRTTLDILQKEVDPRYFLSEKIKPTILSDGSAGFKSRSDINQAIARTLTASMHKMHRACQDNYYSQDYIASGGALNPVHTLSKEELCRLPIRKITPEEAFLLQGFPAQFAYNAKQAGVSEGALYKQAGNAVSVNTVYAILLYLIDNQIINANRYVFQD